MVCQCGAYVSGDYCHICEKVLFEKPSKPKTIKKRSDKMKLEDDIYRVLRNKFLKEHNRCQVYPELKAVEVHHKKGRGKYYLDVSTFLAVSRKAHDKITEDSKWAIENGYSESRLKTT